MSRVMDKPGFCQCAETRLSLMLPNNSRSKQNKKTPELPFVDISMNSVQKVNTGC